MIIELIRHGETALQEESRYQGVTDAPLSEAGREKLCPACYTPDLLLVTSLVRTRQTAEILFPQVQPQSSTGLEEMNFGSFEGRNYIEMEHDPEYRSWVDGGCLSRCPGGESKEEFCERVCDAFSVLVDDALKQGIGALAIVAHGGTQMAIMEHFCTEKKEYYDWHLGSGQGFLLHTGPWAASQEVNLLGITDYNRSI